MHHVMMLEGCKLAASTWQVFKLPILDLFVADPHQQRTCPVHFTSLFTVCGSCVLCSAAWGSVTHWQR
jgi:hypothetical protein